VIAAVNGVAAGAGAVLAAASDIRVLAESASFRFLFTSVGLSGGDMGICWLLPRIIGLGRATEALMLGAKITSQEAVAWGLASKVVADDELDRQHPASEEEYFVSRITAEKINRARERGGRIIAMGTTVVRALESAASENGSITEAHGYTRLKIDRHHKLRCVEGLLTGLHEPEASHLDLLSAFLPAEQIHVAYREAVARRYLWHEFGDLNLIL